MVDSHPAHRVDALERGLFEAGLELVQRILTDRRAKERYLTTRSALHHGPATKRGDDYFGATVNLTARLTARAAVGQVALIANPGSVCSRILAASERRHGHR